MYRGFDLEVSTPAFFSQWESAGQQLFGGETERVRKAITAYVKEGAIDAKGLQEDWFGPVDAQVFISHSHTDQKLATSIAGYLHAKLGVKSFIDSCVWGHADALLAAIDDEYSRDDSKTYNYKKRNRSTSHVHMMLSTALSTMIDRAECVVFLNTPKSIVAKDVISNAASTASPWIYAELATTRLIRKRSPQRERLLKKAMESRAGINESAMPEFYYDATLSHLTPMTLEDLKNWGARGKKGLDALDALYLLKPEVGGGRNPAR